MKSPATYSVDVDKDLDDAALWAVIDSAAAASIVTSSSTKPMRPLYLKYASPISIPNTSPQLKAQKNPRFHCNYPDDDVSQDHLVEQNHRPQKIARVKTPCVSEITETSPPPLAMVKHVQRTPVSPLSHSSPGTTCFARSSNSPNVSDYSPMKYESEKENVIRHSLSGQFPSVSLFKEYQDAAMAVNLLPNFFLVFRIYGFVKYSFSVQLINLESKRLHITIYITSGISPGNSGMDELNTWQTISYIMNFTWFKKCKDNLSFSKFMYEVPVMKHTLNIRHNA